MKFSQLALDVFNALKDAGGKVYIVGGSVRDEILNINDGHDVDVEVYGLSYSQLCDVLSSFGDVNTFGKAFAISKLSVLPHYDFALPRKESKTGNKHQDFDIVIDPFLPLQQAAKRRDLTMNALMYDVENDEIIDCFNGLSDIDHRVIRCVCPDTFIEDPLRVLRIAQFIARFQMDVDCLTFDLCKQMVSDGMLQYLSNERIYQEYCKILMADHPSLGFMFLKDIGALPSYLEDLVHTMQRLDYHPEGDVFTHTMLVLEQASLVKYESEDPLSFMWSCLLHDIGKPLVTTPDGHAHYHNISGLDVFKNVKVIASKKQRRYIQTMIQYHMHLMNMSLHHSHDIKYLRLLKKIEGKVSLKDLLLITKCDKLGRGKVIYEQLDNLDTYIQDKINRLGDKAIEPLISGDDLLRYGYCHQVVFKEMLEIAYDYQLQGMSKGKILRSLKKYEQG